MHPTVYDNIKTVVEGIHYDFETENLIKIIDRNDFVNLAKLSRRFEILYSSKISNELLTKVTLVFENDDWVHEVINSSEDEGCSLKIKYYLHDIDGVTLTVDNINSLLNKFFWNFNLTIDKIVRFDENFEIYYKLTIAFNTKFTENDYERIEDICIQNYKLLSKLIEESKKGEIHAGL
jgi:hypothetical protein